MPKPILAAGGALWRQTDDAQIEVAIIHRPRYDDWSLPKGKVDPGETEPAAAVREIYEETGNRAHLARALATVRYPVEQGPKQVRYWAARSLGGEFAANDEVDEMAWMPIKDAMKRLS
jgi:8-oxo-dGTP diphosphatase